MGLPALVVTIFWSVVSKLVVDAIQDRRRGPLDWKLEEVAFAARKQARDARVTALEKRVEALNERCNSYEHRMDALAELIASTSGCDEELDPGFFFQFRSLADELKSIRSEGISMQGEADALKKEFEAIRTRATALQGPASL